MKYFNQLLKLIKIPDGIFAIVKARRKVSEEISKHISLFEGISEDKKKKTHKTLSINEGERNSKVAVSYLGTQISKLYGSRNSSISSFKNSFRDSSISFTKDCFERLFQKIFRDYFLENTPLDSLGIPSVFLLEIHQVIFQKVFQWFFQQCVQIYFNEILQRFHQNFLQGLYWNIT